MKIKVENISSVEDWIGQLKEFQLDNYFQTNILGRAYEYIKNVEIVEESDLLIESKIQGINTYSTTIKLKDKHIVASCDCAYDGNCKHLAAVILKKKKVLCRFE